MVKVKMIKKQFQGILKPAYNSVDMAEVELMDNDRGPRDFDEGIIMVNKWEIAT